MALTIPNLDRITKENPSLSEAIAKVQTYVTQNVALAPGNKKAPPTFVTPGVPRA